MSEQDEQHEMTASEFFGQSPKRLVGGKANPEFYRWQLDVLNASALEALNGGKVPKFNYDQMIRGIMSAASYAGLKAEDLMDQRTELDKAKDVVNALCADPDRIWAMDVDETIRLIEIAFDKVIEQLREAMKTARKNGECIDRTEYDKFVALKKEWCNRLNRVGRLRKEVLNPVCRPLIGESKPDEELAQRASQVLRFMVYVGRSSITGHDKELPHGIYDINLHHGQMALGMYLARNKIELANRDGYLEGMKYESVMITVGPGHGKSEYGCFATLQQIGMDPYTQGWIVHSQLDGAQKNLRYIAQHLDPSTPQGARFLSLYPVELARKKNKTIENNATKIKLKTARAVAQPTLTASGVYARKSGGDANWIWFDDTCDQIMATQEQERKRALDRINGTWLPRLRGQHTFNFTTNTVWHEDDPNLKRLREDGAKSRYNRRIYKCVIPCGGPTTDPEFFPVWRSFYPASFLREQYKKKGPYLYSCIYQCNPISEESRQVKKVRLYDPADKEHVDFMAGSIKRLSLDPSATMNSHSDKAAMLYVADGSVRQITSNPDGGETVSDERRLRVLDGRQFLATQSVLVEETKNYCVGHPVDYVHVEVRGAFNAIAEMFKNQHGLDTIRHDPTNRSKADRFKAAAVMIDDSSAGSGFRAVVEFPGVYDDRGRLIPHPSVEWLIKQIMDFGFTGEDHGVDALSQVCIYLMPELRIGSGAVTDKLLRTDDRAGNRMAMEYARMNAEHKARESGQPEKDLLEWATSSLSEPF